MDLVAAFQELAALPGWRYWALFAALGAGAGAAVLWAFGRLRRARLMEDTPTVPIASAPQGHVEVVGRGDPVSSGALSCPLTSTSCLWYRYSVHKKEVVHTGKNRHVRWVLVDSGVSRGAFWLRDGGGGCLVQPAGAEIVPHVERSWRGDSLRPYGGPREEGWFGGFLTASFGNYKYKEELILSGRDVYALGWFETLGHENRVESDVHELLKSMKGDRRKLLERFDANGDGEIDLDEWEKAREAAMREVLARRVSTAPSEPVHTLSLPPDAELPFVISGVPQAELAGRWRRHAAAGLALFFLLGAAAARLLHIRLQN